MRAFKRRCIRPTGKCKPARVEREIDLAFDASESLPAFPPALFLMNQKLNFYICSLEKTKIVDIPKRKNFASEYGTFLWKKNHRKDHRICKNHRIFTKFKRLVR